MRVVEVESNAMELVFSETFGQSVSTRSACSYVTTCGGKTCRECQASTKIVDNLEEAKQFFADKGLYATKRFQHLVRVKKPQDPMDKKSPCHWIIQCPRDKDLDPLICAVCPASRVTWETISFEEAVAWWKEAKLVRRYR